MRRSSIPSVSGSLERYLEEIKQFPLLTITEERELARTSRPALVTANLRFVVKIAHEYRAYGFKLADLIQEGNIGLMRAVEKFDPDRGVRLVSYAAWWIRAYIRNHIIRSHSLVKPGEVEEMTARLSGRDLSLDAPAFDGGDSHLESLAGEGPSQDHELSAAQEQLLLRTRIGGALARLDGRERYLIEQRVMSDDPTTLREIGDHFGISHERARQLEARAKRKLEVDLYGVASEFDWPTHGRPVVDDDRATAARAPPSYPRYAASTRSSFFSSAGVPSTAMRPRSMT